MRFRLAFVAAGLAVALAVAAIGCKNGGSDTINLDDYFKQLDELQNGIDASFEAQDAASQDPAADATGEELAAYLRENITASVEILEEGATDAADIEAPADLQDEHDALTAAIGDSAAALQDVADSVPDSLTMAELEAADVTYFSDEALSTAFDRIGETCNVLQAVAVDNDIVVDLACDE